ncbi:MAG: threonine--tRNA ligase, partial [Clostridia bacterium]|nr:threonine--tRNA ligase [Clostridia bacterium]
MFRQDDSHNYVTKEQIGSEIKNILSIADKIYKDFNLPYILTLSTRPDDFMGEIETWNKAEDELKVVLNELCGEGKYRINEGDGAFYGPKIDIKMQDCLGREWQMGTIQVDFQLPQRFELSYIDKDGSKQMPIMIHRAILGSFERFIGIITEHFAGAFPTWLSPVQVKVISVSEKSAAYADKIAADFDGAGIRVEVDNSDERIGYKIRLAQMEKVPYMIILGENEANSGKVSIRKRNGEEIKDLSFDDALSMIRKDIANRV